MPTVIRDQIQTPNREFVLKKQQKDCTTKLFIQSISNSKIQPTVAERSNFLKLINKTYRTDQFNKPYIKKDSNVLSIMKPKLDKFKYENNIEKLSGHHILGKSMLIDCLNASVICETKEGKDTAYSYMTAVGIKDKNIQNKIIKFIRDGGKINDINQVHGFVDSQKMTSHKEKFHQAVTNIVWPKWNIVIGPVPDARNDDMCDGKILDLFFSNKTDPELKQTSEIIINIWDILKSGGIFEKKLDSKSLVLLKEQFDKISKSPLSKKRVYWYPHQAAWVSGKNFSKQNTIFNKHKEKGQTKNPNGSTFILNNQHSKFRQYTKHEIKVREDYLIGIFNAPSERQEKLLKEYSNIMMDISEEYDFAYCKKNKNSFTG